MAIKFPALHAVVKAKLFANEAKPSREDFDSDAGFEAELLKWSARQELEIGISLVDPAEARKWRFDAQRVLANERKRLRSMRAEFSQEDAPEIYEPQFFTEEYLTEQDQLARSVLAACLVSVSGIEVEGLDVPAEKNVPQLIEVLNHVGLLELAAITAQTAQSPSRTQPFLSARS